MPTMISSPHAFEAVEANWRTRHPGISAEADRRVVIGKVAALDGLDPDQSVGADTRTRHGPGRQICGDASGRVDIDRSIDTRQTVEYVITAEALECIVAGGSG